MLILNNLLRDKESRSGITQASTLQPTRKESAKSRQKCSI